MHRCFTVNAVVSASAMGSTVDTTTGAGSTATSVSSVATSSGQKFLVFVYRNSSCKTGDSITSISGRTVTSAQQQTTLHIENNLDLFAWVATGSGTTGAVTINFTTTCTNTVTVVNIVGLSGYNTTTPIAQSPTNTGNSTSATATLSSPSAANGEVVFLGIQGAWSPSPGPRASRSSSSTAAVRAVATTPGLTSIPRRAHPPPSPSHQTGLGDDRIGNKPRMIRTA